MNRRCRKEGKCSLWSGRGSGGKDVQLSFCFVHRKTKKEIQRTKSRHLLQIQRLQSQFLWLLKRKGGGGVSSQTDERRECVCVCMSASVGVSIALWSPVNFARMCLCFSYVLLTIWSRSPFLNDKSEAVRDS